MKAKAALNCNIDRDLLEKARDIVYWTPGMSLNKLITMCLHKVIETIERDNGGAFPTRDGRLKTGNSIEVK